MKYEDVIHAPLGRLKSSVDAWGKLATKLETLATEARDGMQTKADRADWKGLNSTVTRDFIRQTVKEFADAAKAAKGMHALLSDAHTAFKQAKDELVRIRDTDGPEAGIRVDGHGKVSRVDPLENDEGAKHDPDFNAAVKKEKDAADAWQRRIDRIVDNCGDADESFKLALEANTKDAHDFTAPTYSSLDQEEAHRASELLAKGAAISNTQLAQLDELLLDNNHRPTFATAFYDRLGPEKSMTYYAQIAGLSSREGYDKKLLKGAQDLQRALGLNLATASHDKDFRSEWGPALRKLGTQRLDDFNVGPGNESAGTGIPYGYQAIGGVLRHGNYDPEFLVPIAEHVTQLHADDPKRFDIGGEGITYKDAFNPSGKTGAGYDPVTSVLEALGHSPEASRQFFDGPPTLYNEDGSKVDAESGETDLDGDIGSDYLNYFANPDFQSFADTDQSNSEVAKKSEGYVHDAFGHALESATLGRPWDGSGPGERTERGVDLMERVVQKYDDAALLKQHEELSDSLGRMGAAYIDDLDWAIDGGDRGSIYAPPVNEAEKHVSVSPTHAARFLEALGQHPDSYAVIGEAQKIHTMSYLDQSFDIDDENDQAKVRSAASIGAQVHGILDESRVEQIKAEEGETLEDYEKEVERQASWTEFAVTTGVSAAPGLLLTTGNPAAAGASSLLVPLATDVGVEFVNHVLGLSIGEGGENAVDEKREELEEESHRGSTHAYQGGRDRAGAPIDDFMRRNVVDQDFRRDLKESLSVGYSEGVSITRQLGNKAETG